MIFHTKRNLRSDVDAWDAWDDHEEEDVCKPTENQDPAVGETNRTIITNKLSRESAEDSSSKLKKVEKQRAPVQDVDILALDVKLSASGTRRRSAENDMDFFADMTPVIPKTKSGMEQFQSELENAKKVGIEPIVFCFHFVPTFRETANTWGKEEASPEAKN